MNLHATGQNSIAFKDFHTVWSNWLRLTLPKIQKRMKTKTLVQILRKWLLISNLVGPWLVALWTVYSRQLVFACQYCLPKYFQSRVSPWQMLSHERGLWMEDFDLFYTLAFSVFTDVRLSVSLSASLQSFCALSMSLSALSNWLSSKTNIDFVNVNKP